jgi:uncharacterized protein YjlB
MAQGPVGGSTELLRFEDDGRIPNNPKLRLVVYRLALARSDHLAQAFEKRFAANGWINSWRDGIFDYHHFHSNTHEVLGVAQGEARVCFGGEQGKVLTLSAGDVAILPAGTGHKCQRASEDFLVVGAYPEGRDFDICRGIRPSMTPPSLASRRCRFRSEIRFSARAAFWSGRNAEPCATAHGKPRNRRLYRAHVLPSLQIDCWRPRAGLGLYPAARSGDGRSRFRPNSRARLVSRRTAIRGVEEYSSDPR